MRERDKPILKRAKVLVAFGACLFAVTVWACNPHDHDLCIKAFQGAIDLAMFGLGATGAVMVSDSVEAIMTREKNEITQTVRTDPKDIAGLPD